jgi:hypothetical protein
VPRNSVGPSRLQANSVTGAKVKNGSLVLNDFKLGQLVLGSAARADDVDPPPQASAITVNSMSLRTRAPGRIFVLGALRDPFLTCGGPGCSAQWGVYVDDKPVPNTGLTLSAATGESDGRVYHTLFGVSAKVDAGRHRIRLARTDSAGLAAVGQIGSQLGAIQLSG